MTTQTAPNQNVIWTELYVLSCQKHNYLSQKYNWGRSGGAVLHHNIVNIKLQDSYKSVYIQNIIIILWL